MANVRGYSLWGNIWACHLAQSNGMMSAFNAASQSGGVINHHQMNNFGAAIGTGRDNCTGMFHSRSGGAMCMRYSDHLRGHFKNAYGNRAAKHGMATPMAGPTNGPKMANTLF